MDDFQLGYCMGLIAGEGSFSVAKGYPILCVTVSERDPEMLKSLQKFFGGHIYGPYDHPTGAVIQWRLQGSPLRSAIPTFIMHLPECHKRAQFHKWLSAHQARLL